MGITNKAISKFFLNVIIRTNHGQTEIVMQYGGLRSSVTCMTTSCSNDSFSVDVFATVKIHRKHYSSCVTHLCTSGTTYQKPLSNDWLVLVVIKFRCCRKGRTIGSRISSLYITTFNVPWTIFSRVRPSWQILAQTITLPPPKRLDSYTQWSGKRSRQAACDVTTSRREFTP
jgi:hypothetical protein